MLVVGSLLYSLFDMRAFEYGNLYSHRMRRCDFCFG